ncbi:hypothetical protein ZPAH1_orf00125 [Aeromonas phage ZPAH1]|nr:hypothetical protein ASwh1_76 [Aeromonas phage Aswh_1]QQG33887.1 hypothetical protein ZPAH1_orf00125 [Aeromonas phage ZPAH1]
MHYEIKVNYVTGDSFKSYETSDTLGIAWKQYDDALTGYEELMQFIEFYNAFNDWGLTKDKENNLKKILQKMPWATSDDIYDDMMMWVDKDKRQKISTWFITGYFERFISAEIVLAKDKSCQYGDDYDNIQNKYGHLLN